MSSTTQRLFVTGHGITIPTDFIILIDEKPFIKYGGLVRIAHQTAEKKFNGILTQTKHDLVQLPNKDNYYTAVIVVEMSIRSLDTKEIICSFTGTGDASPDSVDPMIKPHLIRQAETRAIARALRIMTDVGMTAVEELGNFGEARGSVYVNPDKANEEKPPKSAERAKLEGELRDIKKAKGLSAKALTNAITFYLKKEVASMDELSDIDIGNVIKYFNDEDKKKVSSETTKKDSPPPVQPISLTENTTQVERTELINKIKEVCTVKSIPGAKLKELAQKEFNLTGEFKAKDLTEVQLKKLLELLAKSITPPIGMGHES